MRAKPGSDGWNRWLSLSTKRRGPFQMTQAARRRRPSDSGSACEGQRHLLVGREPVADNGVFVPGIIMLVGGAGRRGGERKEGGERGEQGAGFHGYVSGPRDSRFEVSALFPSPLVGEGGVPHSTSVNCSTRLRWIIEKLSSETRVSTVSPSSVTWETMPIC